MGHGRHIKIVGHAGITRIGNLGSVDRVRAFLLEVVQALGMRALGEPVMHDVDLDLDKMNVEPFEDEGGVTGIVVLSTSHCAIHTWPLRNLFVFDAYSCRDFHPDVLRWKLKQWFGCEADDLHVTDMSHALLPPGCEKQI